MAATSTKRNALLRVLTAGVLSVLLVFISWALTRFVTPGVEVAHLVLPETSSWLPAERIEIAAIADFALWFAFVWSVQNLFAQLRTEVEGQGKTRYWMNPLRHASTLINAILCALPFSYYVVFGVSMFLNRGRRPESALSFVGAIALSLAVCASAICGVFASAVRFWPRSSAQSDPFRQ